MEQASASNLAGIDELRRCYGNDAASVVQKRLAAASAADCDDAESLARFHDTLLFLRAFPQGPGVVPVAEQLLASIPERLRQLRAAKVDLDLLDSEEFSGMANTEIRNTWTFETARWLVRRYRPTVRIDWHVEEQSRRMAVVLPNLLPLLEDDSFVEPDTPYTDLMELAAGGADRVPSWLLQSFQNLPIPLLHKTALYDALDIDLVWQLGESPASRTLARLPADDLFYQQVPLIGRKQVSLDDELGSPALPLRELPPDEGAEILDFVRDALAVRYRELHGTTHGNPNHVYQATAGRGVLLYIWGLTPEWRLPLRGYFAGITVKNGVPVNYFEAIGLAEWLEVGFNTFYAFREGETAWVYSKVLHLLHQLAGTSCFSVYPYQLGFENEEAIASGAFWFYRKLGFRPGRPEILAITEKEEAKMKRNPAHRTTARTLRKLSAGHVFYEFGKEQSGLWDTFSVRNIERKVQQHMAEQYGGDAAQMRLATASRLAQVLGIDTANWTPLGREAFRNFACILALVPGIADWPPEQREAIAEVIRAKVVPEEGVYMRLMQKHLALKEALLRLGSEGPAKP